MADSVSLKGVVKHLVDGTFEESLCIVCLLPLGEVVENICTVICKEHQEYSIAEVLESVCQFKITPSDNYSVCSSCFSMASTALNFYITAKRSEEILNFYVDELEKNVNSIEQSDPLFSDSLCITLPEYIPSVENFDYDIEVCLSDEYYMEHEDAFVVPEKITQKLVKKEIMKEEKNNKQETPKVRKRKVQNENEDKVVVVVDKSGKSVLYKMTEEGGLQVIRKKSRKKRDPMEYVKCTRCPVKYRFLSKLRAHMKEQHDVDLYICKICKAITEDGKEFENHLSSHTDVHCCDYCNIIFKKRQTIITHLKWHEQMWNMGHMDNAHVCEICGFILPDEIQLKDHYDKKHYKKFTCFYCSKMYKCESSLELHIKKHEMVNQFKEKITDEEISKEIISEEKPRHSSNSSSGGGSGVRKRTICDTCGKDFVDERSLLWHSMLHTNERPHTCDVCGRGFISLNRRNQHMLCAHTMPTKRCPLCPALFHLRSMVNSHIKKVHLKAHKRRNRSSKHQESVHWRTERVPIQELSVAVQNELLDLM